MKLTAFMLTATLLCALSSALPGYGQNLLDVPAGIQQEQPARVVSDCNFTLGSNPPQTITGSCTLMEGDPLVQDGALGGNEYDLAGNLYVRTIGGTGSGQAFCNSLNGSWPVPWTNCDERRFEGNRIWRMHPDASFTEFASVSKPLSECIQASPTVVITISRSIASSTFNLSENALYLVIEETEFSWTYGNPVTCAELGGTNFPQSQHLRRTFTLVKLTGFSKGKGSH